MVYYYHLLDSGSTKRQLTIRSLITLLILGFLACIVVLTYKLYNHEGERSSDNEGLYNLTATEADWEFKIPNMSYLFLEMQVNDIDPVRRTMKMHAKVMKMHESENVTLPTVYITIDTTTFQLPATSAFAERDITDIATGDINKYPTDSYVNDFYISVTTYDPLNRTRAAMAIAAASATHGTVPFGVLAYATMQNWRFNYTFMKTKSSPSLEVEFIAKRSATTIGFSIFITILMWILSLAAMLITVQVVVRGREVIPPLIAVMVALLFALPSVRNTQPNVPPIGTRLDVLGLFFNMSIVAICVIVMMLKWVNQSPAAVLPKSV